MPVSINLKEVFSADNASDLASKLNFNFNQLIALGVGQPGLSGSSGTAGTSGPRGRTGLGGASGSKIWSATGTLIIDLSTDSPTDSVIGDYYVGTSGIYTKEAVGTEWKVIADFDALFLDIVGQAQPWRSGINTQTQPARIIIPINSAAGLDRITEAFISSSGDYTSRPPNWSLDPATSQNAQGVIFNFDVETTKRILEDFTPGLNSYMVKVGDSRLGSNALTLNEAFPYTALLSLYSFYDSAIAPIEADQFSDMTGYRHQLELGSVDDIREYLHSADSGARYVISPTYQNLRVRKYRLTAADLPGQSVILVDFNLHASDGITEPALNSKFTWSINKKTASTFNNNSIVTFGLSNSTVEGSIESTVKSTGILVDGLHLRMAEPISLYQVAIGFDPNNTINATKHLLIKSDSSNTIDSAVFDKIGLIVKNEALQVALTSIGLTGATGSDVGIYASDVTKEVKLGSSSATTALKIKGSRLNSAVPFAVSSGTLPTMNSSDANTLDEYQEGTFTPTVSFGSLPTPGAGVLTNSQPTISDQSGIYVKIGKLLTFTIRFKVKNWTIVPTGPTSPPYYSDPYTSVITPVTVGNLADDSSWSSMKHEIGNEAYHLIIQNVMDQWPDITSSDRLHFTVSINPYVDPITKATTGYGLRSFPMTYSWTGTGSPSTTPWEPIDPSSIYAKFNTYEYGVTKPQLSIHGHRQNYVSGRASWLESNVSIYDFLNYVHPSGSANNDIEVVVHGTYITNHQTAQDVYPIGITTTTTTAAPTTTTTTDPLATTTSTTAAPTTTTTTGPTTTTTTGAVIYGPEQVRNADATGETDWVDSNSDGRADSWLSGGNYEQYSIVTGNGFRTKAQRVTRQNFRTGDVVIKSNDFAISNAGSSNYELTFMYRASGTLNVVKMIGSTQYKVDALIANTGSATLATVRFGGDSLALNGLGFIVKTDGYSGNSIWFEIDQVSCREVSGAIEVQ